jgi:hypothetical protein
MSIVFYLCLLWTNVDPVSQKKLAQLMGPAPLGLHPGVLGWLLETILFVPFPWVLYHFGLILFQERRDRLSFSFLSVFDAGRRHPHLGRSKWICIGGYLYFLLVCGIWIFVCARVGI